MTRRSILTLMIANIASKPVGLLRQMLFALFYGVTAAMSACRFAQTITLASVNFFTADTLNAGFLPLYERYKQESQTLAQCFFWYLFALLIVFSVLVFVILYMGAPWIVHWFAPGFHGAIVVDAEQFIRVFSFGVPFCLLGILFSYLAMSGGSYFGIGTRPLFESVGLIMGVLLSVWHHRMFDIAWAFVIAYALYFSIVVSICLYKKQLHLVSFTILMKNNKLLRRDFWKTIRPLLILPIFMQGKYIVEKLLASLMAVSVIVALDYARCILETGVNVLATPIGLLSLSAFSVIGGAKLSQKIETLFTILLSVSIPITLFLIINSKLVITTLYGYGAFDKYAIEQTSTIFIGMSLGFFAQVIGYVLIKVLSAQLQNRRILIYMSFALACNIIFIIAFFRVLGPLSLGVGESVYAIIVFILCVRYFNLFQLCQEMLVFLVPASALYAGSSIYLARYLELSSWLALFNQLGWFVIYWGIVLLVYKRTRMLFLEVVWMK